MNMYSDKVVICPKHYLGVSTKESEACRYPKVWIKIEDYYRAYQGC